MKTKVAANSNLEKKEQYSIGRVIGKDIQPADLDIDSFEKWEKDE